MADRTNSTAYTLAEAGFDVWLGNNRGNKYSRLHQSDKINPDLTPKQFFDFSFETLGQHDVPAIVDKITSESGRKKITWIGHSQGTSQMFSALSAHKNKIADKINLFVAFAPIARMKDLDLPALVIVKGLSVKLANSAMSHGIYELFGPAWEANRKFVCKVFPLACQDNLEKRNNQTTEED